MKNERYAFIHSFASLIENGCTARDALILLASGRVASGVTRAASSILSCVKKGESLASACISSGIIGSVLYYPYLLQFEKTGNLLASLRLILEDLERKNESRAALVQALLYPVLILATAASFLALLYFKGLPWMLETGLIRDTSILPAMREGTAQAALFLLVSGASCAAIAIPLLTRRHREYSFWAMLVTLTDAGLTYSQALDICSLTSGIPYRTDGSIFFFRTDDLDLFSRTVLLTAELTGDYQTAFKTVSQRQKSRLTNLNGLAEKVAEPLLMAVTGIVILMLSVSVFLPVFNQTGGVL